MKEKALWLYQKLTRPRRNQLLRELRRDGNVPIAILFYHRIADRFPNDWTMTTADFARQLDWLQEHFDVVSLEEAQRRIQAEYCDRPTVSITFDDGYADNSSFAIPELHRRSLPATYFVATDFVKSGAPFPHDLRAGRPLDPNSIDQLRAYQEMGIEIGAHTCSHCDVGSLVSEEEIKNEIIGSVQQLEQWLGKSPRYFAFPFGLPENTSQLSVDAISKTNLAGFCTAYGAWNWPRSSGFHMRRIHADPGLERLKNWLTLDSRKLEDHHALPFEEPTHNATALGAPAESDTAHCDTSHCATAP